MIEYQDSRTEMYPCVVVGFPNFPPLCRIPKNEIVRIISFSATVPVNSCSELPLTSSMHYLTPALKHLPKNCFFFKPQFVLQLSK